MGRAKADLPFGGETLLQRIVRIVGRVAQPVLVVAGPEQAVPEGLSVVRDEVAALGPLAGLANGLSAVVGEQTAFVTGCDYPFLSEKLIQTVIGACPADGAAIPVIERRPQPLVAAYSVGSQARVAELLQRGERSLHALLRLLPWVAIDEKRLREVDPELAAFAPVNTPDEYAAALARLRSEV